MESEAYPDLKRSAQKVLAELRRRIGEGYFLRHKQLNMEDFLLSQNALRLFLIQLAKVFHAEGLRVPAMEQQHPKVTEALEVIDHLLASPQQKTQAIKVAKKVSLSLTHLDERITCA